MTTTKVAVVSGSNKGICYAIVRALCKQFDGDVYLTARNESLGKAAVQELEKEGLHPKFHQLDITDEASVMTLAKFLKNQYNGIDILVNNAAIGFKYSTVPCAIQTELGLKTNYWGTLTVCKHLIPLVKSHGRVVHVSSRQSHIALHKCSEELRNKLLSLKTIDQVNEYMTTFVNLAKEGKHTDNGWATTAYSVSKIGVTLITPIQQQLIDQESHTRNDIIINACCPGGVATDLTDNKGPLTIDQGADTPVFLALLPPNATEPLGQFVSERKVISMAEQYTFT